MTKLFTLLFSLCFLSDSVYANLELGKSEVFPFRRMFFSEQDFEDKFVKLKLPSLEAKFERYWKERQQELKRLIELIFGAHEEPVVRPGYVSERDPKHRWIELESLSTYLGSVVDEASPDRISDELSLYPTLSKSVPADCAALKGWSAPTESQTSVQSNPNAPDEFRCPITCETMRDPVVAADGFTYERSAIQRWIEAQRAMGVVRSPKTGLLLDHWFLTPNLTLRNLIRTYELGQHEKASASSSVSPSILCLRTWDSPAPASPSVLRPRNRRALEWQFRKVDRMVPIESIAQATTPPSESLCESPEPPAVGTVYREAWRVPTEKELESLQRQRKSILGDAEVYTSRPGTSQVYQIDQVRRIQVAVTPPVPPPTPVPRAVRTEAVQGVVPHPLLEIRDVPALQWLPGTRGATLVNFADAFRMAQSQASDGWRLPTIWELFILFHQRGVLIDDYDINGFWSETPCAEQENHHWYVYFDGGIVEDGDDRDGGLVHLVRSIN